MIGQIAAPLRLGVSTCRMRNVDLSRGVPILNSPDIFFILKMDSSNYIYTSHFQNSVVLFSANNTSSSFIQPRLQTGKMAVMLRLTAEQYRKLPILANESTCSGKTYIVTGSNSGLGLETARHLVKSSATTVVLAVRNLTSGENAKKELEKSTGKTGVIKVSTVQNLEAIYELTYEVDNGT